MTTMTFDELIGRKVVFNYYDDMIHKYLDLQEAEVQQTTQKLVKLSGAWYRLEFLEVEAVLPIGEPSCDPDMK